MNPRFFIFLRSALLLLASAILVTACARDSAALRWDPPSPAERELRERVQDLKDTVWEGTTVTAIVGALLGGAVGGAQGVARGAQAGRLAGAAAGRYVSWKQKLHEDRVAVLRAVAADLRVVNAKTAALVASMEVVLEQERKKLNRWEDNVEVMKRGLATAKAQHRLARESRTRLAKTDSAGLEPIEEEIARQGDHISDMKAIVDVLAKI